MDSLWIKFCSIMDLHLQNAFLVLFASFHQEELFSNSLRMDHAMNLVLQINYFI